jgi:Outer membrane protein beta-barrel domain
MKTLGRSILIFAAAGAACFGQQWEVGGLAGGSFLNSVAVSSTAGTARAGFQPGAAFGAYVGYNSDKHLGGELRYGFMQSNQQLSSGGEKATFGGIAHVVHYDVILRTSRDSKVQLFGAVGGGLKVFRGTGQEASFQPLSKYGYFTKTQELKPMLSVGGGLKWSISKKVFLRTEFRDYITAFPKTIIAPAPGTKYGMLLHNFVPMVGIGIEM